MKFVEYPEDKKADSPKETEGQTRGGWFPNGNIFWTMVLMFAFLALINTFLFPGSRGSSVVETDYGTFISDVDKGLVYDVVIDGDKVLYSKSAPLTYQEKLKGQRDTTYVTGAVTDPDFVSRLSTAQSPNKDGKIRFVKKLNRERSSSGFHPLVGAPGYADVLAAELGYEACRQQYGQRWRNG